MEVEKEQGIRAVLEAMLFAYGEPLAIKKIAQVLFLPGDQIEQLLDQLETELNQNPDRGVYLIRNGDQIQLGTKPEHYPVLAELLRQDFQEELTPASLEVLTIILYRSPISRAEIDFIRGVNSTYILRMLLIRGLIEREINPKNRLAFLYRPSFELLKFLGVSNPKRLPDFDKLNQKMTELIIREQENQKHEAE
ncbi:MAG: SMC-Scp complex subunit ScpB [Patescibacteria group bacterium]